MNTMMNLNENELTAVSGGDLDIETLYRADKPVTPGIPTNDIESEPITVCPEFIVPMEPVFRYQPQPKIETGIRLWDLF